MNEDPDYYDVKMAGYYVFGISASTGNNWLNPKGLNALPMLSSAGGYPWLTYNIREQFGRLQDRLRRVRVCCGDWTRVMSSSITYGNKGIGPKDITALFSDHRIPSTIGQRFTRKKPTYTMMYANGQ